jgi:glutaredoxin 3
MHTSPAEALARAPMTSRSRVRLYTTPWCAHCFFARELLRRRGIAFDEIDLGADEEARARLVAETGRRTVPLVFIDGRCVGGRRELASLDRSGELQRLGLTPGS